MGTDTRVSEKIMPQTCIKRCTWGGGGVEPHIPKNLKGWLLLQGWARSMRTMYGL